MVEYDAVMEILILILMQILGSLDWDSSDGHYHPSLIILALRRILLHSLVRILDCGWLP